MKITTETADRLVAVENNYANLIYAPMFIIIAVLIFIFKDQINQPTLVYVVGGIFILVGIATLLFRKTVNLTLDKTKNTVDINIKRLIGGTNKSVTFSDVSRVQVVTAIVQTQQNSNTGTGFSIGNANSSGTKQVAHLIMYFKDGTTIDLSDKQKALINSFSISNKIPNVDLGKKIAAFIGVPFTESGQETAQQMVGSVVEAVKTITDNPDEPKI